MTLKRLFKKEYALELFRVAEEDLESGQVLYDGAASRRENILFHVQQAIEKSLKAVICAREQEVPLVHDLNELVNSIKEHRVIPHYNEIFDLTQFATIRRYEEGVAVITDAEIEAAFSAAREILAWARQDINLKLKK